LGPFSSYAPIPQKFFSLDQKISNLNRPLLLHPLSLANFPVAGRMSSTLIMWPAHKPNSTD